MQYTFPFLRSRFFTPLSWSWERVYRVRRKFYHCGIFPSFPLGVPTISIGNLSFGGAGKTPFTQWLAEHFNQKQKKVLVLTRGYRGKREQSYGILRAQERFRNDPREFGDEALCLASRLQRGAVLVGKKRYENFLHFQEELTPDVVLLDDGHQHLKIQRDLNIVLFDALLPLELYEVAPRGYLREGLTALQDAHAVILSRADQIPMRRKEKILDFLKGFASPSTIFAQICYRPLSFCNGYGEEIFDLLGIKNKKVICCAALASPHSFYQTMEQLGALVIEKVSFSDHHYFNEEEVLAMIQRCKENDAYLVVTEKDMVKINRLLKDPLILYLKIKVDFLAQEEAIRQLLKDRIG